jgi:DNA-binding MarR family transcriptional regulator
MTETSGRFAITPARAVEDHRLGDAAYRLLACLGTYSDRDGWCWPSMPTLADRLGITRQAVQRSIRQLANLGYIEVEHRHRADGTQDRNRYRLLFDRALFEVRNRAEIDSPEAPQPDVAVGQPDVAGPQRGRQGDRNVGDTPYNDERTHFNLSKNPPTEGAGAPSPSPEKRIYDLGKEVLGEKAGGQVRKLIRHHCGDLDATERTLRLAAGKSNPRQYVGAVLRGETRTDDVLAETERLYRHLGVSA